MDMKPENILKALEAGKAALDSFYTSKTAQSLEGDDVLYKGLATARTVLFEGLKKAPKAPVEPSPLDSTFHAKLPEKETGGRAAVHEQILAARDPEVMADVLRNARQGMQGEHVARQMQQIYLNAVEKDLAAREPQFAKTMALSPN